jgi:hypothetical protein
VTPPDMRVSTRYSDTPEGWAGYAGCSTGWGEALTLLEVYVEHGIRY